MYFAPTSLKDDLTLVDIRNTPYHEGGSPAVPQDSLRVGSVLPLPGFGSAP